MTKPIISLTLALLMTICVPGFLAHAEEIPTIGQINYTELIKTWINTIHKDIPTVHKITRAEGDKDGTRYFTIEVGYYQDNKIVIEYHFMILTPNGTIKKTKLMTTLRELDSDDDGLWYEEMTEGDA